MLFYQLEYRDTCADDILGDKASDAKLSNLYNATMKLPPSARNTKRFFLTKFFKDWKTTRQGVETRIHGIIEDPMLDQIFSAKERRVDMFRYRQERKFVIINLPVGLLLEGSGPLLGEDLVPLAGIEQARITLQNEDLFKAIRTCTHRLTHTICGPKSGLVRRVGDPRDLRVTGAAHCPRSRAHSRVQPRPRGGVESNVEMAEVIAASVNALPGHDFGPISNDRSWP